MARSLELRREIYDRLSSQLAAMDSTLLQSKAEESQAEPSWGRTELLTLGRAKVFVKRIPVTAIELDSQFSTRNLYDLPNSFNYGIGSFGKSVFRELWASLKCTKWVLSGKWPYFPLTYHYRILPRPITNSPDGKESAQKLVSYWGGNERIAAYELDRRNARHELVLYQEHFPYVLDSWLRQNPNRTAPMLESLFNTIEFLGKQGAVHFDAHFENVVTDGEHPYLTDFGLVLDKEFSLSEEEVDFFDKHGDYDYARLISCLAFHLDDRYRALPEVTRLRLKERFGLAREDTTRQTVRALVSHVECLAPDLELDADYVRVMSKFAECHQLMHAFSAALIADSQKGVTFPYDRFRTLLSLARGGEGAEATIGS